MKITPEPDNLQKLFASKVYKVPSYQRNYAWRTEQIEELISDIWTSFEAGDSYFMGTLVLNEDENTDGEIIEIVDGQQRMATFSIFVAICRQFFNQFMQDKEDSFFENLRNKESQSQSADRGKDLCNRILRNSDHERLLILNTKDEALFASIVDDHKPIATTEANRNDRLIIKARKLLTQTVAVRCLSKADGIDNLYAILKHVTSKLLFFGIRVKGDADAYLLFESLNSKGMDLAATDLLKNRILLLCGQDTTKQNILLTLWDQMLTKLERSRLTAVDYLRIYWTAFREKTTKKELYKKVRKHLTQENVEFEVRALVEKSEFFAAITDVDLVYPSSAYRNDFEQACAEMNTLRYALMYPLLFRINESSPETCRVFSRLAVNLLFRNITICGSAVGKIDGAFEELLKMLRENREVSASTIKTVLGKVDDADGRLTEFIRHSRFEDARISKYIWAKVFQNQGTGGLLLNFKLLHLEHILPQSYHQNWSSFDPGENKLIEDWVHAIGNHAILEAPINQSISNSAFSDKRKYYHRKTSDKAIGSDIPQTYSLAENNEWTKEKITKRSADIVDMFPKIWPSID